MTRAIGYAIPRNIGRSDSASYGPVFRLAVSRFDPTFLVEADCSHEYGYTWATSDISSSQRVQLLRRRLTHLQLVSRRRASRLFEARQDLFQLLSAPFLHVSRPPARHSGVITLPGSPFFYLCSCCVAGASVGAVRPAHHDNAHLPLPCVHPDFYRGEYRFINRYRSEVDYCMYYS